jgi:hypothetical protein
MADMMMWYVQFNKKNSIISAEEGRKALSHFKKKYKRTPTTIFVNPEQNIEDIEGIILKKDQSVLKGHIYIAENENDIEPKRHDVDYKGIEEYNG